LFRPFTFLVFETIFVETHENVKGYNSAHAATQQERVVEEGKIGRVSGIFALFTCVVAVEPAA